MPLYAYRCTQCGHSFEKIQSFSDEPEQVCPLCGGTLERPLTAPRLQFKGAGWYVNDYASKSSAPAAEGASQESKAPAAESAAKESKAGSAESSSSTPAAAPATPASTPGTSS